MKPDTRQGRYCYKNSEIPQEEHYVILVDGTYRESTGYEHEGEMGSLQNKLDYRVFTDKVALEQELHNLTFPKFGNPQTFKVYKVTPLPIEVSVKVKVG